MRKLGCYAFVLIILAVSCKEEEEPINNIPILEVRSYRICEDAKVGFLIGTVKAIDQDGDNLSFSLVDDGDNLFEIDSLSGDLKLKDMLDFESKANHTLIVSVFDGKEKSEEGFTVSVIDVDETSTTSLLLKNWFLTEVKYAEIEDWSDLQVSFTRNHCEHQKGSYTTRGVPFEYELVWPSSGTWLEDDGYIDRSDNDNHEIKILEVDETSLILLLHLHGGGGRIDDDNIFGRPWWFKFSSSP